MAVSMKIRMFAALTDYFSPITDVQVSGGVTVDELINILAIQNSTAEALLSKSKVAVNEEIKEGAYQIKENDNVCILPPSSGG